MKFTAVFCCVSKKFIIFAKLKLISKYDKRY